jgi:uncharacterized phage protein (TIGR02218 family)
MKIISETLASHIACEVTTLATCWKLKRRDNTLMGFTNHDRKLVIDGLEYKASTGFTPGTIENTGSLSVDNLDVEGMLSSGSITQVDILAGLYDFAEIDIFQVNYKDVSQGILPLKRGWLGEVSLKKQQFVAEVRGMTQQLAQTIGELYSPSCRATLGDSRCQVNLEEHTVIGTITSVANNQQCTDSERDDASGVFSSGVMTFTSGANNGLSMELKEYIYNSETGGQFILALPMSYTVSEGDSYSLTKGCDKTTGACKQRFDNILNFRGEPHVPGLDRMLETAGTRSN